MIVQLTIDDTLWSYALAATAAQKADPVAQATQVVNDYCRACGDQMLLSPDSQLSAAIAKLDDTGKAALAVQAVSLVAATGK